MFVWKLAHSYRIQVLGVFVYLFLQSSGRPLMLQGHAPLFGDILWLFVPGYDIPFLFHLMFFSTPTYPVFGSLFNRVKCHTTVGYFSGCFYNVCKGGFYFFVLVPVLPWWLRINGATIETDLVILVVFYVGY